MKIVCNVPKLHGELNAAGIHPFPVFDFGDGSGEFTFLEGTDMDVVQNVINAHDPTPLPAPKTQVEILQETVDQLVLDALMGGA